jgi:hypothetical protein
VVVGVVALVPALQQQEQLQLQAAVLVAVAGRRQQQVQQVQTAAAMTTGTWKMMGSRSRGSSGGSSGGRDCLLGLALGSSDSSLAAHLTLLRGSSSSKGREALRRQWLGQQQHLSLAGLQSCISSLPTRQEGVAGCHEPEACCSCLFSCGI